MEPIDTFLKKINKDLDFKIPVNALISFFNPDSFFVFVWLRLSRIYLFILC
jgi:hypothetical protein